MRVVEGPPHDLAGHDHLNAFVEHGERMVRRGEGRREQQRDHDARQQSEDAFHRPTPYLLGNVVLKIGSRDWPGSSGKSVVPRTSLKPSSPGSFEVVVPFWKKSLLLVSHSQCWTRWPAASSSFARR